MAKKAQPPTSSSSSSSEDEGSNWQMLADMWPVQDRPAALQDKRTVNNKDMATLQVFNYGIIVGTLKL